MPGPDQPRRKAGTAFRDIRDEGGMVVVPASSEVHVLNPVGSRVMALLDGKHSVAEIARIVATEFDVAEADAERDVREFLDSLAARGLLQPAEEGETSR